MLITIQSFEVAVQNHIVLGFKSLRSENGILYLFILENKLAVSTTF